MDDIAAELAAAAGERRVIVSTESPPLRDIATVLMKVSQNLYAETLVKAIGARKRRARHVSKAGSAPCVRAAAGWGIADDGFVMADGSGLSRYNYLTARTVVDDPRADVQGRAPPRAVRGDAAHRRQGRNARHANAADASGRERDREDRIDLERPHAVRLRPHEGRRDARVLDSRERLRRFPRRPSTGSRISRSSTWRTSRGADERARRGEQRVRIALKAAALRHLGPPAALAAERRDQLLQKSRPRRPGRPRPAR